MAFGRLSSDHQNQPVAEINMIPMIDVMLVLLIVFILAAPLLVHAVKVDLPRQSSRADQPKPADIQLSLTKDGKIWWNDAPIATDALARRLAEEGAKADPPELHIRADRDLAYGKVADLMALAARQGLHKLAFVSDPRQP